MFVIQKDHDCYNYENRGKQSRQPVASSSKPNAYKRTPNLQIRAGSSLTNSDGNFNSSNHSHVTKAKSPVSNSLINMGQRDLFTNQLRENKLDCPICYDIIQNTEPIWNCKYCYQIIHIKCIMKWFNKSHTNNKWWCPTCQKRAIGKPKYVCFCGDLVNPVFNSKNIPHSCGQTCGQQRKNSDGKYKCKHKCTILCHPGPCPPCTVDVYRKCCCGYTKAFVKCGQLTPIICENICLKQLNCSMHVCEKTCHIEDCDKCVKCQQNRQKNDASADNNENKKNVWFERFLNFIICTQIYIID